MIGVFPPHVTRAQVAAGKSGRAQLAGIRGLVGGASVQGGMALEVLVPGETAPTDKTLEGLGGLELLLLLLARYGHRDRHGGIERWMDCMYRLALLWTGSAMEFDEGAPPSYVQVSYRFPESALSAVHVDDHNH